MHSIRGTTWNVTIQKGKIYYIEIKDIASIKNFREKQLEIDRCLSKKGLQYLKYYLHSSAVWINLVEHSFEIRIVNIKKIVLISRG